MSADHTNLTDAERRVARAEQESVDLEVRSPKLPDDTRALIEEARIPHQSRTDSGWCRCCHGIWPCVTARLADAVEAQAAEVERLRARVAEYEKDAQRLDWLERHIRTRYDVNLDRRPDRETEPDDSLAGFAVSCEPKMIYQGQGETLREAIDAALAPRGPGDSEGGR